MSADLLREAASLMRERAEVARFGRWTTSGAVVMAERLYGYEDVARCEGSAAIEGNVVNALHIASWHPTVALAVADWLDAEAESFDFTELWFHPDDGVPIQEDMDFMFKNALAVARAYLGSDQ